MNERISSSTKPGVPFPVCPNREHLSKISDEFLEIPPVSPFLQNVSKNAEIFVMPDLDPGHLFKRCIAYIKRSKSDFHKTISFVAEEENDTGIDVNNFYADPQSIPGSDFCF